MANLKISILHDTQYDMDILKTGIPHCFDTKQVYPNN